MQQHETLRHEWKWLSGTLSVAADTFKYKGRHTYRVHSVKNGTVSSAACLSLATRGVVRRTCWPKHSLVKPLSPSPQLNLHLGPRYATRISIANTLTGNLTSMYYWILTGVLFLGWFATWMCTSFWDLKSPGLDLIMVIIVLRFMSFFFSNHLLTILVQSGHFQYAFPFISYLHTKPGAQRWRPSSVFSFVHIKRHFQVGNFLPSVYILTPSVQHVICPQCSTLVSQLPSPEAATPVFSL